VGAHGSGIARKTVRRGVSLRADGPRDGSVTRVPGLFVQRLGTGPPVVLVHGGVLYGELTWREQLALAERWELHVVERAGYARSRHLHDGEDAAVDGPLIAELLGDGAHLVGQSSGAVASILAAARRPEAVRSLTLSEPPAFQLAPDSPAAQAMQRELEALLDDDRTDGPWLARFIEIVGSNAAVPDGELPPPLAEGARALRAHGEGIPWALDLPLDALAAAPFPKLVISGDHSPAFEAVCDALAERIGAERAHVTGARHTTPHAGGAFNERLEACLRRGEAAAASARA
jgi:pimeloyl-ACP methyl ester carboxylesterase